MALPAAILLLFAWAQLAAIPRETPTVDEQAHLARGLTYARTGDLRLYIGHPPLANLIAALPLLPDPRLDLALDDPTWGAADWIEYPITLFWKRANPALTLFAAGRIMIVLLGLVLLAVVYRLGADLGGPAVGLAALALAALDPNLRAHARLVTTDLGVTAMLIGLTWLWRRWDRRPTAALTVATGAAAGLALASKFSAIIWVAALAGLTALTRFRRWRALLGLGATAALTVWAVYGFELWPVAGRPVPVPFGHYWDEFLWSLTAIARTPAYLLGRVSRDGFLAYFPVALAVKTPLPLLGLGLAGLALGRRGWRREAGLWFPALAFLAVAVLARINIGYRHLLPALPLVYLAGGAALVMLWRRARWGAWTRAGRWAAGLAAAWLAANTAAIYPRDLTFFNELAGGPDNGWRFLVDSNLDWGQDLGELVTFARQRRIDSLYVSYFGSVPVGSIPVRDFPLPARPLPPRPARDWRPYFPAPGWYAISVTHLMGGAVLDDADTFAFFRQRRPDAVLGRTIYVYRVPAEAGTLAICVNPPPSLNPHEARRRFAPRLTRLLLFDCARGLPLPAGRAWYLLRGEQIGLVRPTLERLGAGLIYTEPHRPDPAFAFSVYQLDDAAAQAPAYAPAYPGSATFGGLATFLGWRYTESPPGRPHQAETVWRVEAGLPAPLSIFLHLTAADGFPLAVSDGLNTPFDALRPGDALIQYHPLSEAPAELPAGAQFQTGLYLLADPSQRYRLPSGRDAAVFSP